MTDELDLIFYKTKCRNQQKQINNLKSANEKLKNNLSILRAKQTLIKKKSKGAVI